jgi:MFS family permease
VGLDRRLGVGASCLAAGVIVLGLSRSPVLSGAALVLAGAGMISQMAGTMTLLQGLAGPALRGRVMGLFSTLFVGVAPFGALASGAIAGRIGVPVTLVLGGAVVLAASVAYHLALPRLRDARRDAHPEVADAGIP